MDNQYSTIAEAARSLATAIPADMIHSLVEIIDKRGIRFTQVLVCASLA
jgi:putative aminopeptidase FrvX